MTHKYSTIKLRRGTADEWSASEPSPNGEVLRLGEPGYEKDTGKLKIGDGISGWNQLPYFGGGASLTTEEIQDAIGNTFFVAGSGININYSDENDTLTISNTSIPEPITINNGSYIQVIQSGSIFSISATGIQPSGNYSLVGHTHTTSDITDFNSSISGLLPSVTGTGYVTSAFSNNQYSISVTGLQPSGNYASASHTHTSSQITDFNSSVSGLLPVKNILGSGNINISSSSGIFTISNSGLVKSDITGITGATPITNIVQISQANYDALSSYDPNTLYVIT